MSSYLLMMFILLFGGAILIGATLDFIGLGPANAISLGLMMNNAVLCERRCQLGDWWWFIPPGSGSSRSSAALYVMNVGLDEVFNPRLRGLDEAPRRRPQGLLPHARAATCRRSTASTSGSPTARSWASPASPAAASRRSARA